MSDDEVPHPEKDLVMVIDLAGHIENLFNQIIADYVHPRNDAWPFMWQVVLDTSVMPLGSKQKVVMAIAHEMGIKLDKNPLTMVINLRNSFAHNTTDAHPALVIGKTPEDTSVHYQFYTLGTDGILKRVKRHEAFDNFMKYYRLARKSLIDLHEKIVEKYPREKQTRTLYSSSERTSE